eukprot:CAMPEP_0170342540 /NCGR_PEP_ID=MMETSP0116_2-20130129/72429_1 /TAXON_ID=400756 /ORGANISM="Durinskia baltica, Strain CSIRO CS-38" /LENGTH=41 /DNA_ID= /DNA_START= /DNA_END= /DNA_ORIENTATION=
MASLQMFSVPKNALTGTLPIQFGLMTTLQQLYIESNMFSGT